jgi:hypothetical protein
MNSTGNRVLLQQSEGEVGRSSVKCDCCRQRHKKVRLHRIECRYPITREIPDTVTVLSGIEKVAGNTLYAM